MSTNGTEGAAVCLHHLALEAWIARTERPANLVEDPLFGTYLRSQTSPQAYRYLRKWVGDSWDEARLVSYKEVAASLSEDAVIASLKGKGLAELTEIAMRAVNANRDLNKAFDAYRDVLSNEKAVQQKGSSGVPGDVREDVRPASKAARRVPSGKRAKDALVEGGAG